MTRRQHWQARGDSGVALLLVIGVVAMLTVLSVTVTVVAKNNVSSTIRDKQSGSAFATAEAGVAEAIELIRSGSLPVGNLTCLEPASATTPLPASCLGTTMSWNSSVKPMEVPVDGGVGPCTVAQTCYKVWIGAVNPFAPPTVKVGLYRIHSKGLFGNGPAARTVVVDLNVKPDKYPIGVFGQQVDGNGGTAIYNESLFTRACVSPRYSGSGNGTRFTGNDVYWDQPASAHSTTVIDTANNGCGGSGIHTTPCPNNTTLNSDQSSKGAAVFSGPCFHTYQRADGSWYPDAYPKAGESCPGRSDGLCDSTSFTPRDLQRYGYQARGLSDAQYATLKARSKAQGLYNVSTSTMKSVLDAGLLANPQLIQPVYYIDCSATTLCGTGTTKSVSLSTNDFPTAFQQAPNTGTSTARCAAGAQPVVTLVIEHGNLVFQSGNSDWFDAAVFVPDGQWRGNGGYNILGTLFANDLSLGGNETFQLDKCFVRDIPAPLQTVQVAGFREDDARDVS